MLSNNYYCYFTAIIQDNLAHNLATPVENWRILLEQRFTTGMPVLTVTGTYGLVEDTRVFLSSVTSRFLYLPSPYWTEIISVCRIAGNSIRY